MTASNIVHALIGESESSENEGDFTSALQQAQQAVDVARALGDPLPVSIALVRLAKVYFRMGKYRQAHAACLRVRKLSTPDPIALVDSWQVTANCAAETDSFANAEACYMHAADLAVVIGYTRGRIAALHGIAAGVYLPRGQFDLALAAELEVRHLLQGDSQRDNLIYPLATTIMVYLNTGEHSAIPELLQEFTDIAVVGSIGEGYLFCLQAAYALGIGDIDEAHRCYLAARYLAEKTGEPWLNINFRTGMSRIHRLKDDAPAAWQWAEDACQVASKVGYRHELGKALLQKGLADWQMKQPGLALGDFTKAAQIFNELQANYDLAHVRLCIAVLLDSTGNADAETAYCSAAQLILKGGYGYLLQLEWSLAFPLVAKFMNSSDAEITELTTQLLLLLEKIPAAPLRIQVLGKFSIYQYHLLVSHALLRQHQAGELFRLLLLSPSRTLDRTKILEAMWPDKPAATASSFLHQATSNLRKALEPDLPMKFPSRYLVFEEGQVSLILPPGSLVDFEQFEVHLARGEWHQAVALWKGEPFSDDASKDWSAWKREQLIHDYLRVLLALEALYAGSGSINNMLEICQTILQYDPWQEQAILVAMQACLRHNNRSQALDLYRDLEQRMRSDLGISPLPELQKLYQTLNQ